MHNNNIITIFMTPSFISKPHTAKKLCSTGNKKDLERILFIIIMTIIILIIILCTNKTFCNMLCNTATFCFTFFSFSSLFLRFLYFFHKTIPRTVIPPAWISFFHTNNIKYYIVKLAITAQKNSLVELMCKMCERWLWLSILYDVRGLLPACLLQSHSRPFFLFFFTLLFLYSRRTEQQQQQHQTNPPRQAFRWS